MFAVHEQDGWAGTERGPAMPEEGRHLLSLQRVARMFDAAPRTIRRWIEEGRFPEPITVAGVKRWRQVELERLIEEGILGRETEKKTIGKDRPNPAKPGHEGGGKPKPA